MTLVDQRTGTDCLRACVATILGLRYEDVPDFLAAHDLAWAAGIANWVWGRGLHTLRFRACGDGELLQSLEGGGGLWMANGPTGRGTDHAVVYRGFELVHDPHASRAGLESITGATVFVPREGRSTLAQMFRARLAELTQEQSDAE